jgi:hypothetical protein
MYALRGNHKRCVGYEHGGKMKHRKRIENKWIEMINKFGRESDRNIIHFLIHDL